MPALEPRDPDFEAKVRASFARQRVMDTLGARLTRVEPGVVEIELAHRQDLTQQHGFIHAGIVGTIADSAGGYAGFSLMPPGSSVLTVEYKINMLAPAQGGKLQARGTVIRSGRTLTICQLEVFVHAGPKVVLCCQGQQTLICLEDRSDE